MNETDSKNLKRRYLVWFYKEVKEKLDKVERKFTQLDIDQLIVEELKKLDTDGKVSSFISEFKNYARNKQKTGLELKYSGKEVKPEFRFLEMKLVAIEKVIAKEFGKGALADIKAAYEREMTERILKSTEHK